MFLSSSSIFIASIYYVLAIWPPRLRLYYLNIRSWKIYLVSKWWPETSAGLTRWNWCTRIVTLWSDSPFKFARKLRLRFFLLPRISWVEAIFFAFLKFLIDMVITAIGLDGVSFCVRAGTRFFFLCSLRLIFFWVADYHHRHKFVRKPLPTAFLTSHRCTGPSLSCWVISMLQPVRCLLLRASHILLLVSSIL